MASFTKLASGSWRVQVRHKGRYVSESFQRREDARRWATDMEGRIDRGELPTSARARGIATFEDLIDLHVADMKDVGKAPGRSKDATLAMLKRELGSVKMTHIDRERVIQFGRKRAAEGAGPVTLSMDIGAIRLVLAHAAAVHGLPVSIEQVELGRIALKRLGLVGKSNQRNRRPTDDELAKLIAHFDGNPRQLIPMGRIIKFAVATAMRQEEICRVTWSDLNERTKMLTIRDRKDPREKKGNDQRIPLLAVSGYDAMALIDEQRAIRERGRPHLPLQPQVREQTLHPRLPGPAHRGPALPRPAPRGRQPPVRSRLPDRAGLAGHRPQGLEDAAPLYPPEAGVAARLRPAGGVMGRLKTIALRAIYNAAL